jgi:hypothetical protein
VERYSFGVFTSINATNKGLVTRIDKQVVKWEYFLINMEKKYDIPYVEPPMPVGI